jgi:hypothetical protein
MTDTQQANKEPVKETPVAPMPSAEPKTPETTPAPEAVPEKEVPSEIKDAEGLPEEASERTKREFDKLREELRTERASRTQLESAFKTLQPLPAISKPQPIYDPNTGLLNEQVFSEYQQATINATTRAERAEKAVNSYLEKIETEDAYKVHPEANPKAKEFDPELKKLASGVILSSMVHPEEYGGKQLGLREAYDLVKSKLTPREKKVIETAKKEGAQEALEQLTPKEQASLEATGSPAARKEVSSDIDSLRRQSRVGGNVGLNALASRMAAMRASK